MRNTKCPICGGALTDIGKAVKCEKNNKEGDGCSFILWKNSSGHEFSAEEFDELLDGKRIKINCIGRESKKPYIKEVYLNTRYELAWDRPFEPQERTDGFV